LHAAAPEKGHRGIWECVMIRKHRIGLNEFEARLILLGVLPGVRQIADRMRKAGRRQVLLHA
jgi:hypothetical protein